MTEKFKVVYNDCYGGYNLSEEAENKLKEMLTKEEIEKLKYEDGSPGLDFDLFPRHDKRLIKVVEELGKKADGDCARLAIHVLEGKKYFIEDYDGLETVHGEDVLIDAEKE